MRQSQPQKLQARLHFSVLPAERRLALEVVVGSAPGWADPWARARRAFVATDAWHSPSLLADEHGYEIPRADVQLARLLDPPR